VKKEPKMPDDIRERGEATRADDSALSRRNMLLGSSALVAAATLTSGALAQAQKAAPASGRPPNILVIMGDDIGQTNVSAYSFGVMGYRTPNIDRLAREGMMFTDYYAEQSCTAGRSSFITGQATLRTGLSKVGLPGADLGLRAEDMISPKPSSRSATRPANSARTTSATKTSSCRRCTGSTSSSATFITSTPRKSRRTPPIQRTPVSRSALGRGASSSAVRLTATTPQSIRASARLASRPSKTPAR
jgi:alkaline phosphatase